MSWYEEHRLDKNSKRLEKIARKFQLGEKIEEEISDCVSELVMGVLQGGVNSCIQNPNEELSPPEGEMLWLNTEEFKGINRISEDRFSDNLSIELIPQLCYEPSRRNAKGNAFYIPDEKFIVLSIVFGPSDLNDPMQFFHHISRRMSALAKHEVLHFLRDEGGFEDKTNKENYISPNDDGSNYMEYMTQNVELENHLSDFHNNINSGLQYAFNTMPNSLNTILTVHKMPDSQLKRKTLSRIYSTIQEMEGNCQNDFADLGKFSVDPHKIFQYMKRALMLALRNDSDSITKTLDQLQALVRGR
jgi:hypothetical protein